MATAPLQLPRYDDVPGHPFTNFQAWLFGGGTNNYDLALGSLVARILAFAIIIAGLIFFVKLIVSGFSYLTSAGDPGKVQAATKNLTNAVIGLLIVVTAFFLAQVLQVVFGIKFL